MREEQCSLAPDKKGLAALDEPSGPSPALEAWGGMGRHGEALPTQPPRFPRQAACSGSMEARLSISVQPVCSVTTGAHL